MRRYIRWFGRLASPFRKPLLAMMFCHMLLAACSIVFVYVCKRLVDTAVAVFNGNTPFLGIGEWMAMLIVVVLVRVLLNSIRTYLQTKTEIRIKNRLRKQLFDVLLRVNSDYNRKHHSGDILNRIQEDVRVVSSTLAGAIPNLFGTSLQFVAAVGFLLYLDIRLALVVVVVLPVGMLVGKFVTGRVRGLTLDIRTRDSKVQSFLQESIQHLVLLQTLEYQDNSVEELEGLQGSLYKSEMRRSKFSVISRLFISIAFQTGYVVAFMWGVFGISRGTVTYGMMTAFLQLVGQIQRPLLEMSSQLPSIIHSTASADRIMEIEGLPNDDEVESLLLDGVAGISIENMTFSYPDGDSEIFKDFSHDFIPGSRTAVVGPTGIGKSTLIRLLLALLKPVEGSIHIYNSDASHSVSSATRSNLVYVPQGNSLFSGTVRENLLMGNPEATDEELREALHIAAADFVLEHPDGLNLQCFETGGGLSEGQAQRIAIARAMLRPGSILLLDEFSSALDAETESILMERLTSNLLGHTMIFITHREMIINYCTDVLRITK